MSSNKNKTNNPKSSLLRTDEQIWSDRLDKKRLENRTKEGYGIWGMDYIILIDILDRLINDWENDDNYIYKWKDSKFRNLVESGKFSFTDEELLEIEENAKKYFDDNPEYHWRDEIIHTYDEIKKTIDILEYCEPELIEHHENKFKEKKQNLRSSLRVFDHEGNFDLDSYRKQLEIAVNESEYEMELFRKEVYKNNSKKRFYKYEDFPKSKGAKNLFNLLKEILGDNIEVQDEYHFDDFRPFRLDFYFEYEGRKIGVEYQGEQHFKEVEHWGGEYALKKTQEWDSEKNILCKQNNIELHYFFFNETLNASLIKERIGL